MLRPYKEAELVASDRFSGLFGGWSASRSAVTVGMAIPNRRSNRNRLARVREIGRHRLRDVADRANLHDRRLRLLQHQLFVDRANLGLLFVSFLTPSAVFFRRGHRNIVLQVAHASSVFGVNLQGMLEALQVDGL